MSCPCLLVFWQAGAVLWQLHGPVVLDPWFQTSVTGRQLPPTLHPHLALRVQASEDVGLVAGKPAHCAAATGALPGLALRGLHRDQHSCTRSAAGMAFLVTPPCFGLAQVNARTNYHGCWQWPRRLRAWAAHTHRLRLSCSAAAPSACGCSWRSVLWPPSRRRSRSTLPYAYSHRAWRPWCRRSASLCRRRARTARQHPLSKQLVRAC